MIQLNTLFAQMMTVMALGFVWLAHQWSTIGYGLNPWIALPTATVAMIIPHIINHYFIEVIRVDEYDLKEELSCIQLRNPK